MRLIDADNLKRYICDTCEQHERCKDTENVCSTIADIDEQPTIEADPVEYGRWESQELAPPKWRFCSRCGFANSRGKNFKRCPNCGAKMDGD